MHRLGLNQVVAALRRGEFSKAEYLAALLARIRALEPRLHAFAWLDGDAALQRALDSAPADAAHGLAGVPVAVKDIIDTAGIPTEWGTPAARGRIPAESAAVVRRLEAAGGYVLGKTVTAELAYATPGPTRNPWNPAHTPGGSSSGSAAAVAAGFAPVAIGTQTNGSVIRPAAYCGVVGFKPSSGLVSRAGILAFSKTLDTVGVFARSVEDAARFTCCIAGYDPADGAGVNAPQVICGLEGRLPVRRHPPRLALVRTPMWSLAETCQRESLLDMASRFAAADAEIEEVALPAAFEEAWTLHRTIMYGEAARALRPLQQTARDTLSDRLNALIDEGLSIGEAEMERALAQRLKLNGEMRAILSRFDAIITPPATGEAPATLEHTGDPVFCTPWTLTGLPAVTIPCGFGPRGLPLGVQLVGGYLRDDRLMGVAQWAERVIGLAPMMAPDDGNASGHKEDTA